jgi:uncharacterized protein YkwD
MFALNQFVNTTAKFVTVIPGSTENVRIDVAPKEKDLTVDDAAERRMLELVNNERTRAGLPKLTVDITIVAVARAHSRDMFLNRYFSHVSMSGKDPADRLTDGGVSYSAMGENIAYSPDVETAYQGLIDSPEHKKNIVDPNFHRIGIGIITTASFGMMVTQDFAN